MPTPSASARSAGRIDRLTHDGRENESAERREAQHNGLLPSVPGHRLGVAPLVGPELASPECWIVTRKPAHVAPRDRHADPVLSPRHRREVESGDEMGIAVPPLEGQNRAAPVIAVDPAEAGGVVIPTPEAGRFAVQAAQLFDETHKPRSGGAAEQMPVEAGLVPPFVVRCEFAAHEDELFAWPHP